MLSSYPVCATIPSTDLSRSKDFYTNKLGLSVENETEGGLTLKAGEGSSIYLYKRGPSKADHTLASFSVGNIEATVHELTAKGVVFEQYNMPGLVTNDKGIAVSEAEKEKAAWFRDPDGNILALSEGKPS